MLSKRTKGLIENITVSDDERIWMNAIYKHILEKGEKPDFKTIRKETHEKTSKSFKPRFVSDSLVRYDHHGLEVTLIGVMKIDPNSILLQLFIDTFHYIREEIGVQMDKEEYSFSEISKALNSSEELCGIAFHVFSDIGSLWSSASFDNKRFAYKSIGVKGDHVFETYFSNKPLELVEQHILNVLNPEKQHSENLNNEYDPPSQPQNRGQFISESTINELKSLQTDYDLRKLLMLCKEMNGCYKQGYILSLTSLARSTIDHVPMIFGCKTFNEVVDNYKSSGNSRSFKKGMHHLNQSLRATSDSVLHSPISSSTTLIVWENIDFQSNMNMLLTEIVRVLRQSS